MANVWYPDTHGNWYTSNTGSTYTFNPTPFLAQAPRPDKQPPKPPEDPDLAWLRQRVDEVCELSGITT